MNADSQDARTAASNQPTHEADRMFWVDFENPPRHPGDPIVALTRLMHMVGDKPYVLRLTDHLALREKRDGSGEMERFKLTRFEAWPPDAV